MNKFKFSFTILLLCISTSVFSASWSKVQKITIEADETAPPYMMDIAYKITTTIGKPGDKKYSMSSTSNSVDRYPQAHFSEFFDAFNSEFKTSDTKKKNNGKNKNKKKNHSKKQSKSLSIDKFIIYRQTPGDLTDCDIAKYKVKGKKAVTISVVDGVCSLA